VLAKAKALLRGGPQECDDSTLVGNLDLLDWDKNKEKENED